VQTPGSLRVTTPLTCNCVPKKPSTRSSPRIPHPLALRLDHRPARGIAGALDSSMALKCSQAGVQTAGSQRTVSLGRASARLKAHHSHALSLAAHPPHLTSPPVAPPGSLPRRCCYACCAEGVWPCPAPQPVCARVSKTGRCRCAIAAGRHPSPPTAGGAWCPVGWRVRCDAAPAYALPCCCGLLPLLLLLLQLKHRGGSCCSWAPRCCPPRCCQLLLRPPRVGVAVRSRPPAARQWLLVSR
jgi:hypothetical protein